jgi:adenosine deaminase
MKLVAEYLADALKFEQLAAQEKDADLKLSLLQQAAAYRKLAEKRAKDLAKSVPDAR